MKGKTCFEHDLNFCSSIEDICAVLDAYKVPKNRLHRWFFKRSLKNER